MKDTFGKRKDSSHSKNSNFSTKIRQNIIKKLKSTDNSMCKYDENKESKQKLLNYFNKSLYCKSLLRKSTWMDGKE
jgi:hypothetical protein